MGFTKGQKFYITCIKRPIDFFGSLLALIILSPIFVATIIFLYFANKNGWKGVFFVQPRPGKNEKIFNVIKFKTMTDERDSEGNLLPDADRLTKVGKLVRSTSIDELPQLINVLKGDMSFIGPRPLLIKYLSYYTEDEKLRHIVRPGISGWAQVNGRNTIDWDKKLLYDIDYVKKISFFFDLKIFIKTIYNVIKRSGIVLQAIPDLDEYRKHNRNDI